MERTPQSMQAHREQRRVFLHELAHIKRNDLYANLLAQLVLVFFWYNPLVVSPWMEEKGATGPTKP